MTLEQKAERYQLIRKAARKIKKERIAALVNRRRDIEERRFLEAVL